LQTHHQMKAINIHNIVIQADLPDNFDVKTKSCYTKSMVEHINKIIAHAKLEGKPQIIDYDVNPVDIIITAKHQI